MVLSSNDNITIKSNSNTTSQISVDDIFARILETSNNINNLNVNASSILSIVTKWLAKNQEKYLPISVMASERFKFAEWMKKRFGTKNLYPTRQNKYELIKNLEVSLIQVNYL